VDESYINGLTSDLLYTVSPNVPPGYLIQVEPKQNGWSMNKDGQHIIETKDENVFLLPRKAFLEIRRKLQTNADVNYNINDAISLVNNGCSLFQIAQYQLNNQTIDNISLYLPQASTIMNLVSFSADYSRLTASNMLWFKDTGTGNVSLNSLNKFPMMLIEMQLVMVFEL